MRLESDGVNIRSVVERISSPERVNTVETIAELANRTYLRQPTARE